MGTTNAIPDSPTPGRFSALLFEAAARLDDENRNVFARSGKLAGQRDQAREPETVCTTTIENEPLLNFVRVQSDGELRALRTSAAIAPVVAERGGEEASVLQLRLIRWGPWSRRPACGRRRDGGIECFGPRGLFAPRFPRRDLERVGSSNPIGDAAAWPIFSAIWPAVLRRETTMYFGSRAQGVVARLQLEGLRRQLRRGLHIPHRASRPLREWISSYRTETRDEN